MICLLGECAANCPPLTLLLAWIGAIFGWFAFGYIAMIILRAEMECFDGHTGCTDSIEVTIIFGPLLFIFVILTWVAAMIRSPLLIARVKKLERNCERNSCG